jgi:hypothetical protein
LGCEIRIDNGAASDDRDQPLHGNAFAFDTGKDCLFAYGRANFTKAALLRTAGEANLEDLIAVRLPFREAKIFVPRLLDPSREAVRLLKPDQLVSVPEAPDEDLGKCLPIKITEAEANDEKILLWLENLLERFQLRVKLEFLLEGSVRIPLRETGSSRLEVHIDPETFKRLSDSSAIITSKIRVVQSKQSSSGHQSLGCADRDESQESAIR